MAKRLHPKTIEDKIHQILCMDQDQDPETNGEVIISSKKCYLNLDSTKSSRSPTLGNMNYPLKTHSISKPFTCDGYPQNTCRFNVQTTVFHQQKVKPHFCRSNNM